MGLAKYLVIDKSPSAITLRITGHRQATSTPSSPWQRTVYPDPAQLRHSFCDSVLGVLVRLCRIAMFVLLLAIAAVFFFVQVFFIDVQSVILQVVFFTAAFYMSAISMYFRLDVKRLHLDADKGVFVAGFTRFDLSHVCFFHVAERISVHLYEDGTVQSVRELFLIEVVSMYDPIVLASFRDRSAVQEAVKELNTFLRDWQLRTDANALLPRKCISHFRDASASVTVLQRSTLLRDRPRYCSLYIKEKGDGSVHCYRKLRICRGWYFALRFCAFGLFFWLTCFAISLHQVGLPLGPTLRQKVIGVTVAWAVPLLLLLLFCFRREVWDIRPGGMVRHRIGWGFCSISRLYDVSNATAVKLELVASKRPGSSNRSGTNKIGGRRFRLRWCNDQSEQPLRISKLCGGEAAYLADKLRLVYPHMFGEDGEEELHEV